MQPVEGRFRVKARGQAFAAGEIAALDILAANAATTGGTLVGDEGMLYNIVAPVTGVLGYGIFVVVEKALSQNHEGYGWIYGYRPRALLDGNVSAGDPLSVKTNGKLVAPSAGEKVVAIAAAASTAGFGPVIFDGEGQTWGQKVA